MLNRRILRIKAFQNLYAYEQCKGANLEIAKDQIRTAFLPDLNSMEFQDKKQLKEDAQTCIAVFTKHLSSKHLISQSELSTKIKSEAIKAIHAFHELNKKDLDFLSNNMVIAAEKIPQLYLFAIELVVAFGKHVAGEEQRKQKRQTGIREVHPGALNLSRNRILSRIQRDVHYRAALTRLDVDLEEISLDIKDWFRTYVKPDEAYQTYVSLEETTEEKDAAILEHLIKKIIFKAEPIVEFLSSKDLHWSENKAVIRSLASKVIKNASEGELAQGDLLPEIAMNWEEDKEFFQNIVNFTIANEEHHRDLIAKKTENWDIERVALTDKIILSMALTEMKQFPSIPTKVSINEYIDISKHYSTPKSKQFVNGLLDVLSKELTEAGEIRKSGRGLLDNR
ncbi:MAG: transcription antitermination factor NusB [Nitritalea sp.]